MNLQKSKLLFIDDDPGVIASLKLLFAEEYETFSASTAQEGLRLFDQIRPKVVLLDLRLPDRNGIEALREIRQTGVPTDVIIITGNSTRMAAEDSLRLGAAGYFNKPFNSRDLTNKIKQLILSQPARENERQLEHDAKASVETLNDFQDLQNASTAFLHDVSNPLSSLMMGIDLLGAKIDKKALFADTETSLIISTMSESVYYLSSLVEQWRSFSELHTVFKGRFEANKAIDLAVNQVIDQVHASNILLQIQIPKTKTLLLGNQFALVRVLVNLLKNAIDAAPPSKGLVHLTATIEENRFTLVVSDNGLGISPEKMDRIFTPHYTTKTAGKGFGLFIAKKIIEAISGTISMRSPGTLGGADFIVTLPITPIT